jgi:uncharacterized ParB-like nuclease family protein
LLTSESKIVRPIVLDSKKFKSMLTVMKPEGILKWKEQVRMREKRPVLVLTEDGKILSIEEAVKKYGGE